MAKPKGPTSVTFTTKGRVVIPRHLRRQFDIEAGTRALVLATENGILLKPVTAAAIRKGRGILKRKGAQPLSELWAGHKREERKLEAAKELEIE